MRGKRNPGGNPHSPPLTQALTLTLLLTVSVVGFGGFAPLAAAEEGMAIEEVVVTGTRIQRSNANSPQPISMIEGEALRMTGNQDISEVLNKNPALLASVTSGNSFDSAADNVTEASNVGGSALDLRGLGFERTLTLVNGRRHVSGVEGTSAVDVTTIPSALIERVEVLTGGASAVYGADAVTGVVNFVLKDDYEGAEISLRGGVSGESDAESYGLTGIWGKNFDGDRANLTVAFQYDRRDGLRQGDRGFFSEDGVWNDDVNPALRFQIGDIDAGATPNFSEFYNFDNTGLYPVGLRIPSTAEDFIADYEAEFGTTPNLSQAELDLINRSASAPPRAFLPGRTFSITSPYGVVAAGDFGTTTGLGDEPDLNGNGTSDCLDSFLGYNSSLDGAAAFGAAGGCWVIDENGELGPYNDGQVAGTFNQFGASQSYIAPNRPYVTPDEEKYSININGRFEFMPQLEAFIESKYVNQEIDFGGGGHNFTDLLYGAPDNPFIPEELAELANNPGVGFIGPGGLYMSRDSDDWGSNISTNERETWRIVSGIRGDFDDWGLSYELSANYGRFERELTDREDMIADRFFAAIDVATDPATGQPVCRSDLDPNAFPRTTPFNIFPFVGGGVNSSFFTFSPGDGQCRPADIWNGRGAMSQESIDFMTYTRKVEDTIEQTVFTGFVTGDSASLFELPAGPVSFAVGFEYREEESSQEFGELDQGIIQVDGVTSEGIPFSAGDFVGDVSNAGSLGEDASITLLSTGADYDVWDFFMEVSVPLLADVPGAYELTVDGAWRRADYSTFGTNDTYKVGGVWAPIPDVRIRGNYSEAVRVPNIFELFSPDQGQFFRPQDPCDATQISSGSDPALRQANCEADLLALGVDPANIFDEQGNYAFQDPLSAGFPGVTGGNINLTEEEATTKTIGFVLQPRFIEGLTISWDYWDIEIDSAIEAVSAQNTVDGCYDGASLNNAFCDLIERNADPTSAQSGGLTFLRQTRLNFGSAEADGWDLAVDYNFDLFGFNFLANALVTKQESLSLFEPGGPGEPDTENPELEEMRRPEWTTQFNLGVLRGPLSINWRTQYLSSMVLGFEDGGEVETVRQNYGSEGWSGNIYFHDVNGTWDFGNGVQAFAGIDNVTDENPFETEFAYPLSPIGRYFWAGFTVALGQ